MKQKGFTLAEVLGVIVLIGVLAIVAFPPILNQLTASKEKLDEATLKVLSVAAEQYIDEHGTMYPIKNSNVYCIKLKTLVNNGLKSPILDGNGKKIDEEKNTIKVTINGINNYKYELVKTDECLEIRN